MSPPLQTKSAVKVEMPVTPKVVSRVTASSTFKVPSMVVITPVEPIVTAPPPEARVVAPLESNVDTLVSPVTSKVESRVTASSTFKVPLTVVITPVEQIATTPPPEARVEAPVESNVDTLVSPVTSKVESRVTASSTFKVPLTVVAVPVALRSIAPPPRVTLPVEVAKMLLAFPVVPLVMSPPLQTKSAVKVEMPVTPRVVPTVAAACMATSWELSTVIAVVVP